MVHFSFEIEETLTHRSSNGIGCNHTSPDKKILLISALRYIVHFGHWDSPIVGHDNLIAIGKSPHTLTLRINTYSPQCSFRPHKLHSRIGKYTSSRSRHLSYQIRMAPASCMANAFSTPSTASNTLPANLSHRNTNMG